MPRINLLILSSFLHFGHFFTLASIFRGVRHPAQIQTDVLPRIWSNIGQWSLHAVQSQSKKYCKSIHKLHMYYIWLLGKPSVPVLDKIWMGILNQFMKDRSQSNVTFVTEVLYKKWIWMETSNQFMKERSHSNATFVTEVYTKRESEYGHIK